MDALTVRRDGDWMRVYDRDGSLVGSSIVGFGDHAAAAVDVAAALLRAVSDEMPR